MKYFFDHFSFTSGGALGSLTLGLLVKELWKRGWPPGLSVDKGSEASQQVQCLHHFCIMTITSIGQSLATDQGYTRLGQGLYSPTSWDLCLFWNSLLQNISRLDGLAVKGMVMRGIYIHDKILQEHCLWGLSHDGMLWLAAHCATVSISNEKFVDTQHPPAAIPFDNCHVTSQPWPADEESARLVYGLTHLT